MKVYDTAPGDFQRPEDGTHLARSIRLVDLGTQPNEYRGRKTERRQVALVWELPLALITEGELKGQPFMVSKIYTASLAATANLRLHLESWRGRPFDEAIVAGFELCRVLDKPCMVTIGTNDRGWQDVLSLGPVSKDVKVPKAINPVVYFSLEPDEFDPAVFETLSSGYRWMIMESPEYQGLGGGIETDSCEPPF